ncbi:MAG TPA: hypothetical protein VGZ25_04220 [Gemmataceae bacterium]|nr:hypothetical protein [Gemmataceae bacterium]
MTTGQIYDIHRPDLVLVGRRDVSIGITKHPEGGPIYDQLTRVALAHITELQDLPHTVTPGGNGTAQ